MNILVLGSGGREHAISWKIKQSQKCENLYVAPGNAGTAQIAENVDVNIKDFEAVKSLVLEKQIELVVVGPEEPLVLGIVDFFKSDEDLKSIKIIGPDKVGAQLEGSKDFAKDFMFKYDIPTAKSKTFTKDTFDEGIDFLENTEGPYVLKADGLAAGKGVIITSDREEAQSTLRDMLLDAKFGDASSKVVIEEFLSGIELSVFILMDGDNYVMLPEAKDYKRIGEGDTGPNTGGMGAVSPVVIADKQFMRKVKTQVVERTVEGLKAEGIKYTG
ncbi:MAG: phosphoribosylamine--glycine ligase, partial [bacterium]|nr:phosphoribosylamine--glycine ligase [bacterium]